MPTSRREFVKATAAVACTSTLLESTSLYAKSLKLPLAIQLYSVRDQLPKDYAGTLKELGNLGYREVESAGYYDHTASEVKQAIADANLKLVSAHYSSDALHKDIDQIIDFQHQLGVTYIICSFPGKNPSPPVPRAKPDAFTLDDFKWNAHEFNKFGEKVAAAGMKFGYHNHTVEFRETDGAVPFVELMRLTDPAKVTVEMDCGWVIVGGGNPIELLRQFPKRISMLHVKDFNPSKTGAEPTPVELGHGTIDYRPILEAAANTGNIRHCFVEQEAFTVLWQQSLKIDADYMRKLGAV